MSYGYLTSGSPQWDSIVVEGTPNSVAAYNSSGVLAPLNNANFSMMTTPDVCGKFATGPINIIGSCQQTAFIAHNAGTLAGTCQECVALGGDNALFQSANNCVAIGGNAAGFLPGSDQCCMVNAVQGNTANVISATIIGMRQGSVTAGGDGCVMIGDNQASANAVNQNNALFMRFINGVAITNSTSNVPVAASALLQLDATNRGFLPPRMTTAQKTAIAAPTAGLQVYDTTLNQMSYYNGTVWVNF